MSDNQDQNPLQSGQSLTDSTPVNAPNTGSEGNPANTASGGEGGEGGEGKTPWYIKVIAQRAHEAREARREANTVKAQNAELLGQLASTRQNPSGGSNQGQPTYQQQVVQPTQAEIDASVNAELSKREFDKACNDVWTKGSKEIPDFKQSLDDTFGVVKMTPGFLQTVVALQEPHKILHTLAKNPEETHRIMNLNAQAQAIELARLEQKTLAAPQIQTPVSNLPPPIKTVDARRASGPIDLYDTAHTDMASWMAARSEQKRQRMK